MNTEAFPDHEHAPTPAVLSTALAGYRADLELCRPACGNLAALDAVGEDWREVLFRDGFNLELLADALAAVAIECADTLPIVLHSRSPLTARVGRALTAAGKEPIAGPGPEPSLSVDSAFDPYAHATADAPNGDLGIGDPQVVRRYGALRAAHGAELAGWLQTWLDRPGPRALFVSQKAYFNQMRTSYALRAQGWETAALVLDPSMLHHKRGYFDAVRSTDLISLLEALTALEADTRPFPIHTQGWLFRYHIAALIDAFRPATARLVVEFMDSNTTWFGARWRDLEGPMSAAWGPDAAVHHERQLRCERHLVRSADGLLYPGDTGFFARIGTEPKRPAMSFCSYPLRAFFRSGQPRPARGPQSTRLVFVGGVTPATRRRPAELFHDSQMVRTAELLLEQGFQLDLFNNPLIIELDDYPDCYPEHLALMARHPDRYSFRRGDLPERLNPRLADYHYGVMLYDFDGLAVDHDHFRFLIPTKLFHYLEAGLPVLVSERWQTVAELVRGHGCGVVIDDAALRDLSATLARINYPALKARTLAARDTLAMDRQAVRLTAFYRSL